MKTFDPLLLACGFVQLASFVWQCAKARELRALILLFGGIGAIALAFVNPWVWVPTEPEPVIIDGNRFVESGWVVPPSVNNPANFKGVDWNADDGSIIRLWIICDGKKITVQRLGEPNPPIIAEKGIPDGGSISFSVEISVP